MDFNRFIKRLFNGIVGTMTIQEIARYLGVDDGTVYRWQNCQAKPSGQAMVMLVALYEAKTGQSVKSIM
ncbi:MAG: hypothetical protein MJ220_02340 [Bacilli bacterium]|nr:hypothetical protein [Bacilli bacterium]